MRDGVDTVKINDSQNSSTAAELAGDAERASLERIMLKAADALSQRRCVRRTKNQERADRFDCDLFRLIGRAAEYSALATTNADRKAWHEIWCNLRAARRGVRPLMHQQDRAETE
jgi:hypothetical protein